MTKVATADGEGMGWHVHRRLRALALISDLAYLDGMDDLTTSEPGGYFVPQKTQAFPDFLDVTNATFLDIHHDDVQGWRYQTGSAGTSPLGNYSEIIVFRGTDSMVDVRTDVSARPKPIASVIPGGKGKVHGGILHSYKMVTECEACKAIIDTIHASLAEEDAEVFVW